MKYVLTYLSKGKLLKKSSKFGQEIHCSLLGNTKRNNVRCHFVILISCSSNPNLKTYICISFNFERCIIKQPSISIKLKISGANMHFPELTMVCLIILSFFSISKFMGHQMHTYHIRPMHMYLIRPMHMYHREASHIGICVKWNLQCEVIIVLYSQTFIDGIMKHLN